jgi:hypothetical protein
VDHAVSGGGKASFANAGERMPLLLLVNWVGAVAGLVAVNSFVEAPWANPWTNRIAIG